MIGFSKGAITVWYRSITRVLLFALVAVMCASAQPGRERSSSSTAISSSSKTASGKTVIRFMPSWSNTSAIMIANGTETIMTAVKNYCGWFEAKTEKKTAGFTIRFKQTIGNLESARNIDTTGIEKHYEIGLFSSGDIVGKDLPPEH